MRIKNRYENKCENCSKTITVGTEVELLTLTKCQECKRLLSGDTFISDMNRLCNACWHKTLGGK